MQQALRPKGRLLGLMKSRALRKTQNAAAQQPHHKHQRKKVLSITPKQAEAASTTNESTRA